MSDAMEPFGLKKSSWDLPPADEQAEIVEKEYIVGDGPFMMKRQEQRDEETRPNFFPYAAVYAHRDEHLDCEIRESRPRRDE